MCGGTGGDFPKFQHAPVKQVVLIDISHDSVEEARRRHANNARPNFDAHFFCGDAFSLDSVRWCLSDSWEVSSFDLINCQFALHYAFQSIDTASEAFRVISYYLRPGGKCIITVPDAQFILHNAQFRSRSMGVFGPAVSREPYFEVKFPCMDRRGGSDVFQDGITDENGNRIGDYLFSMGNCVQNIPEYLVREETFKLAAEQHGLKVTMWKPFREVFQEAIDTTSGQSGRELAVRLGCMVETLEGPTVDAGAWTVAELYVAIVLEK